jgi:tRNA G18 (ribose-2'-O)-methylase SpoU
VACRHVATAAAALRELRENGYTVYGVETAANAAVVWNARFQLPAALVFGNEALGVSPEALALCDKCVRLPCFGVKNSINVGNCAAVVLYRVLAQWLAAGHDWTETAAAMPGDEQD